MIEVELAEVCDRAAPIMYGILQPGPHVPDGVPYVRPTEIVDHQIAVGSLRRTTPAIARQYNRASLRAGDVLLSIVGTIGKTAIVPSELNGANITQSSVRIRPDTQLVSAEYLKFALRSPQVQRQYDLARLGTGVPRLNVAHVRALRIPYVQPFQQKRLTALLNRAFSFLAKGRAALTSSDALLARLRQSVLAAAFRGDLTADWRKKNPDVEPASVLLDRIRKERRQKSEEAELAKMQAKGKTPRDDRWKQKYLERELVDQTDLPELPEHWCWATVGSVIASIEAGSSFACEERPPSESEVGVLKVSAVTWGTYDESESKTCIDAERVDDALFVKEGDFLFSRANTIELVGSCVIAENVNGRIMLSDKILRFTGLSCSPRWLLYALRTPFGRAEIERLSTGNQLSMRNIGQERIRAIRIPVAPDAEMKAIIERVDEALERASSVEKTVRSSCAELADLEAAILAKAFRGELVPQDPNDEPASVLLESIRAQRAASGGQSNGKRRTKSRGREAAAEPEPAAIAEAFTPRLPIRERSAKPEPEAPRLTIDDVSVEDTLAAIRRVLETGNRDREALVRDVARELGFARTGTIIRKAIDSAINTASRRLIIRSERGVFTLYSPSIEHYEKDELKQLFLSAIGTTWWDRDEAVRATARYLGFKRTGDKIDNAIRSVINGLIRQDRIERDGARIRRL